VGVIVAFFFILFLKQMDEFYNRANLLHMGATIKLTLNSLNDGLVTKEIFNFDVVGIIG